MYQRSRRIAIRTSAETTPSTLERETGQVIKYLFPHFRNGSGFVKGDRLRDFKKAWATACKEAGCRGMLRHDEDLTHRPLAH